MKLLLILTISLVALLFGCRTNDTPDIGISSVTNVSVNSANGVVTLSGQVDSAEAKAEAAALASAVPKVVRVVNNLQVVTRKAAIACCGQSS